jgi:hypothetical protein
MNDDLSPAEASMTNLSTDFADADAFGAILGKYVFFGHAVLPSYAPRMGAKINDVATVLSILGTHDEVPLLETDRLMLSHIRIDGIRS